MRYWEDFEVDRVEEFGAYEVTEAEIIEFGRAYDPLPFHVDPEAAKHGPYGALTAPGLLTCAIFMRLIVDHVLSDAASLGSPGVDSLRWVKPVFAGDTLSLRQHAVSRRILDSRPDTGLIKNRYEVLNQHREVVCEIASNGFFRVRGVSA